MRKISITIIFLILFLVLKAPVFAEKINSFDVDLVAQMNGEMQITESINYDFEIQNRHGIYRYIPLYTKVGDLYRIINISDVEVKRDGEDEQFTKSVNNNEINLKIGDPDKTITGAHNYLISYTVENGIGSNFSTHDEIYWNATGNDWEVPIESASINIKNNFGAIADKVICFTGSFGSKDSECTITGNNIRSDRALMVGEGLSAVVVYPKDTFPPSILSENPPESVIDKLLDFIIKNIFYIYAFFNIIIPLFLIYWYQKKKNKNRFGKVVVNFDIPKDEKGERIGPALAGIIDSARLERDDVVATIFDLAIRKYIKLESIKKQKKFSPDKNLIKITKLNDGSGLDTFEKELFDRLFKDNADYVFVKDLKKDFYKTFSNLEKDAFKTLVRKKYFVRNPKAQRTLIFILAIFSLFTLNIFLSAVLFYLYKKLIGRTALGDEIDFKIDGLKLFLKSMDRNYKWQAEKFYTVEQMIPYAISLGYINEYMRQLKIIKPDYNPSWYSGYRGSFYIAYATLSSSMNSNITSASPSSSGAGGGGFSGGGVGGGGGGSW